MEIRRWISRVSLLILAIVVSQGHAQFSLLDVLRAQPELSTLVFLSTINDPALFDVAFRLTSNEFSTIFAPTNLAFANLPTEVINFLLNNPRRLNRVLFYHIIPGFRLADSFSRAPQLIQTLQGNNVEVRATFSGLCFFGLGRFCRRGIQVNEFPSVRTDIVSLNGRGVAHTINGVLTFDGLIPDVDIIDLAAQSGFNTLLNALETAGLVDLLREPGPFTVFAPTDEAFGALPDDFLRFLLRPEGLTSLTTLLSYHVIPNFNLISEDITSGTAFQTAAGFPLSLFVIPGGGFVVQFASGTANVIVPDVLALNGVVNVIDTVLIPPGQNPSGNFPVLDVRETISVGQLATLNTAIVSTGLDDTLQGPGPFTVFGPTDFAFQSLPNGVLDFLLTPQGRSALFTILTYHVVPGSTIESVSLSNGSVLPTVQGESIRFRSDGESILVLDSTPQVARVVIRDIRASNGIVHGIDKVLIPSIIDPFSLLPTQNLFDFTRAQGLNTLSAALELTNLDNNLRGEGPFTLFAPNEFAFSQLPPAITSIISSPGGESVLLEVLLYHIVVGQQIFSTDITGPLPVLTAAAEEIVLDNFNGRITIRDSTPQVAIVEVADGIATNGVAHTINKVLIPP